MCNLILATLIVFGILITAESVPAQTGNAPSKKEQLLTAISKEPKCDESVVEDGLKKIMVDPEIVLQLLAHKCIPGPSISRMFSEHSDVLALSAGQMISEFEANFMSSAHSNLSAGKRIGEQEASNIYGFELGFFKSLSKNACAYVKHAKSNSEEKIKQADGSLITAKVSDLKKLCAMEKQVDHETNALEEAVKKDSALAKRMAPADMKAEDEPCDQLSVIRHDEQIIATQKEIGNTSGVVDSKALYDAGQEIVRLKKLLDPYARSWKRQTGRALTIKNCDEKYQARD